MPVSIHPGTPDLLTPVYIFFFHITYPFLKCYTNLLINFSVMSDSLQPMDYSVPGPPVHGILQARMLEWVAISYSVNKTNRILLTELSEGNGYIGYS